MIHYACPGCGAELSGDAADAGAASRCPDCRTRFVIPAALPAARSSRRRRRRDDDSDDEPEECKKVPAGVFALLLGAWGAHKFYLGYTTAGVIQIVLTLATCGLAGVVAFAEGIIYLTKTDREFIRTYQRRQREWF